MTLRYSLAVTERASPWRSATTAVEGSPQRILRWSITALLVGAMLATTAIGVAIHADRIAEIADARSAALELRISDARAAYARLARSRWAGDAASAGQAIFRAQAGERVEPIRSLPVTERLVLRRLLHTALERGQWEECHRLAQLAVDSGELGGHLYRAALQISRPPYDPAVAQAAWEHVPGHLRDTRLGREIHRTLPILQHNGTVVRDRQGLLIGGAWDDGTIRLVKGLDRACIPDRSLLSAHEAALPALRLSVDLELGRAAAAALEGWRGTVVLLDARTGELLAAVSDPQTASAWRHDAAFRQRLEPASIMKMLTVAAALRKGLDVDAEIAGSHCSGALRIDGSMLWCPSAQGLIHGLDDAFAASCNTVFAELGLRIGRRWLLAEHHRWGFGRGGWWGRILDPDGNRRQLADLAIGLNATDITPVHAALLAAPVATGSLPELSLIHAMDSPLGLHPEPISREPATPVLDTRQRRALLSAMDSVTGWGGTAALIDPTGFQVAMKTGTGGNRWPGFHVNYIGVGPLPDPWLAFSVRVTGVPRSKDVRRAGYHVTQRLLRAIADIETRRLQLRRALHRSSTAERADLRTRVH